LSANLYKHLVKTFWRLLILHLLFQTQTIAYTSTKLVGKHVNLRTHNLQKCTHQRLN